MKKRFLASLFQKEKTNMEQKLNKCQNLSCHCEKIQASLRASIFEAILRSVTAETLIYGSLDKLCRIASLIRSKILG